MNDSILYRWDRPEAGRPDPGRLAQANALETEIFKILPKYAHTIKVTAVKVPILSNSANEITNREYLSSTMGVGGHIIGFLKYEKGQEDIAILQYTTFYGSQQAFRGSNRPLFIIPGSSITAARARLYDVTGATLDNTIKTCDGVVKVSRLGSLMPEPSTNTAEINFVGNGVEFDGFMITFGDETKDILAPGVDVKKPRPDSDSEDDDESPKLPPLTGFMTRGGMLLGKMVRSTAGVPESFSKVLDYIWETDRVPRDFTLPDIAFDKCPPGGAGGKRSTRKRSRKAFKNKQKKSQKRRPSKK